MEMPGYLDYGKMADMSPSDYKMAMDQVGLAQMYQAEKQKQAEAKSLADMMANDQSSQMNPLLVKQQQMNNEKLGMANEDTGMTLGIRKATYPQEMQDKIEKFAISADENKLKFIENRINLGLTDPDPAKRKAAEEAQQFLVAIRAEKRKQAASMEELKYKETQDTGRALERNASAERIAQIGADSRVAGRASSPADFWGTFYTKHKTARDKHAALVAEATKLGADDPEAQKMLQMAEAIRPQVEAEIASRKPGSVDTGAVTGLPTNPSPQVAPKGASDAKPKHSLSSVMQMYPGVPADKVKEAYKRKFGVDLQ